MIADQMTSPVAMGDAELVNASLAGDREAFGRIVCRHQALVCSLAYSATGNLAQSEDLAQETFLTAWKHLANCREPEKLRSWLCGIARNLIHNFLRSQRHEPSHLAEPLEELAGAASQDPLPGERAISLEEADILWRSLERIPEIYREPLVLYYRQHQSVEAVAEELELTEDAVRQRLTRGRKLLQEEVLAFVEGALAKSAPGTAFTVAVVASLPLAATTAKAATVGAALAKGGAGVKGAFSVATLGSWAGMIGAVLFSWKTVVDESRSEPERRLMARTAWFQCCFLAVSLAATFWLMPRFGGHPVAIGIVLGLILLANLVNGVLLFTRQFRRRIEIVMEEGTWADDSLSLSRKEKEQKALRKAFRLIIPFIIMFACGSICLPWKQHWIRASAVTAGEAMGILWAFGRYRKMLGGEWMPGVKGAWLPLWLQQPIFLMPTIVFGAVIIGAGMVLFMNPAAASNLVHDKTWLRMMGLALLGAALLYAVFAVIYVKKRGSASVFGDDTLSKEEKLTRAMGGFFGKSMSVMTKTMGPIMEKLMLKRYAPVFQKINLNKEERERLEDLIRKKHTVNMDKGMVLMNPKLDPARRAAAIQEMKTARENCDVEIRQLLGEERYPAFARFESSLPDRVIVDIFKTKAAREGAPLTDEQEERFLSALAAARARFPWETDLGRRVQNPPDPAAAFSAANIEIFGRQEEEFDRQFLDEARMLLTEKQFAMLEPFLAKQRKGKMAAMKMTGRMFSPA